MKRFIIICITTAALSLSFKSFRTYAYSKAYDELNPVFADKYENVENRKIEYGKHVDEKTVLVNENQKLLHRTTTLDSETLTYSILTKDLLNRDVEKEVNILEVLTTI